MVGRVVEHTETGRTVAVCPEFDVIDESRDWIVVNKPAPLLVHPTNKRSEPTLLGGLDALLSFDLANGARLGIINRLDRETSGVVVVAKTKTAARMLSRAIERRQVKKVYTAIVYGWPEWQGIEIDQPIARKGERGSSSVWVRQWVHESGRPCQTTVQVARRFEVKGRRFTLLTVAPRTGRMHQIRVHLEWVGFPIVGDKLYGATEEHYLRFMESGWDQQMECELLLRRQALHARTMTFPGEDLSWSAPLSTDLRDFIPEP